MEDEERQGSLRSLRAIVSSFEGRIDVAEEGRLISGVAYVGRQPYIATPVGTKLRVQERSNVIVSGWYRCLLSKPNDAKGSSRQSFVVKYFHKPYIYVH